jgi:hypothetical protein
MRIRWLWCGLSAVLVCCWAIAAARAETGNLAPLLEKLRSVGPEGKGHRAASEAWAEVARAEARQLPAILAGMDGAGPLAANWIRAAVDAICERELQQGGKLPAAELEQFVNDRRHNPRARRLAYEWIARVDPSAPDRLIPRMLDDPSVELRRDAVARVLEEAARLKAQEKGDAAGGKAADVFLRALVAARDADQIKLASDELKKAGRSFDLPRHFGFLMQWKLIGPFDNVGKKGFAVVYPPEEKLDLAATYQGSQGTVQWTDYATSDEYGTVNLNQGLAKLKGAVVYAATQFQSGSGMPVEIRIGTPNAYKLWLNGKLVSRSEVYHSNTAMDQYVTRVEMREGPNVILVKVCQNEQTEDWAADWKFQLRVCDATGTAILSLDRPPTATAANKTAANGAAAQ